MAKRVLRDWATNYDHLREQYAALLASSASFDDGSQWEAKRLAASVRILVHDTPSSTSLLGALKAKDRMQYLDTSVPLQPGNMLPEGGLVVLTLTAGVGGSYEAPLDHERPVPPRLAEFGRWWTADVIKGADNAFVEPQASDPRRD